MPWPRSTRASARRQRNAPATSPSARGKEWATMTILTRRASGSLLANLSLHFAQLFPLPGDHFADEAESEQRDAADDQGLDEVEQRPQADAHDEAQVQREQPGDESHGEQERPDHAEEEHGLAA